jgi:hypothetical protein
VGWVSVLMAAPQRLLSGFGGLSGGLGASVAPLAQTACGVGGVALVGACLGGSPLPAGSVDGHAARASAEQHQVMADAGARTPVTPKRGQSSNPRAKRHAQVTHSGSPAAPREEVRTSPALRTPSHGSGGGGQSGGSSGSVGGTVDDTTEKVKDTTPVPVTLPDPQQVIQDVTDQLPDVQQQVPVPVPPVSLP